MTESGRLKGRGLRQEMERIPAPRGSLTAHIEFGNFGAGVGDLETDGFEARISNNSKRQDALAVSADKKVFVICDGLGGTAGSIPRVVSAWSRAVAEIVAQVGNIQTLVEGDNFVNLVSSIKKATEVRGTNFALPDKIRGRGLGVMTTLSAVERIDPNTFHVLTVGDSPVYVINKTTGAIVKQFGEDAMKGETSAPIENVVGMDKDGNVRSLHDPVFLVNQRVDVASNELLVIASDFFSDHTADGRNLYEYIGLTPQEFHAKATSPDAAKRDDATLIVIDPAKLPPV